MELIHHKGLQVQVQSIDGDRAVLLLPDGQIVRWPLVQLPAGTKTGDTIGLHAGTAQATAPDMHELAQAVINKIFAATPDSA